MNKNTEFETMTTEEFHQLIEEMNTDPNFRDLRIPEEWDKEFKQLISDTLQDS